MAAAPNRNALTTISSRTRFLSRLKLLGISTSFEPYQAKIGEDIRSGRKVGHGQRVGQGYVSTIMTIRETFRTTQVLA